MLTHRIIPCLGVYTAHPPVTDPRGRWFETIPPASLRPANLYKAQLKKRLGR